ncbi:unnamed protein product [Spirodela intermedia]|uniref:Uncharacterized protein n=1 Tax=Spirodela intermedia TaxID=51605 RepID=A0A7I8IVM9_SPIIN|nr:unnamed protein product [Spirodela intermedia]CAA6661199.1 unnamed protein product [Spirodela intermedia]
MDGSGDDESSSCESCISVSETVTTSRAYVNPCSSGKLLKKLEESDDELIEVKHRFYSSLGKTTADFPVLAVYKNLHAAGSSKAPMKQKRGNANVRNAWYGSSKNSKPHGLGAYLSPLTNAIDSVVSSVPDGNGIRYLLLCCVILGNTEEIHPPSHQLSPSTDECDSGVDNQEAPRKYIIWPAQVKTHISPLYVLSIKANFQRGESHNPRVWTPTSPWIPFSRLIPMLSASLPAHKVCLIKRIHVAFLERKITRQQLISQVRALSGDELLYVAIRVFGSKQQGAEEEDVRMVTASQMMSNEKQSEEIGIEAIRSSCGTAARDRLSGVGDGEPGRRPEGDEEDEAGGEDFEFPAISGNSDEIFSNGQIRPIYPLFTRVPRFDGCGFQNRGATDAGAADEAVKKPVRRPLRWLMMEDGCTLPPTSSSERDAPLDDIPVDSYCLWTPDTHRKGPSAEYSSKRWLLRNASAEAKKETKKRGNLAAKESPEKHEKGNMIGDTATGCRRRRRPLAGFFPYVRGPTSLFPTLLESLPEPQLNGSH